VEIKTVTLMLFTSASVQRNDKSFQGYLVSLIHPEKMCGRRQNWQ